MKKLLLAFGLVFLASAISHAAMIASMTFSYENPSLTELAMVRVEMLLDGEPSCEFDTTGYEPGDTYTDRCTPDGAIAPGPHECKVRATLANGEYSAPSLIAMGIIPPPPDPTADPLPVVSHSFEVTVEYPGQPIQDLPRTLREQ